MKKSILSFLGVLFAAGCASVQVQAPKEPIKMDIKMRLDVYQHVVKDIDSIESIVAGKQTAWLGSFFVATAYAADDLPQEAVEAAYRRRDRKGQVDTYLVRGVLAEGPDGLVQVRKSDDPAARGVADAENADRMIIYRAIARKNGSSVEDVQKVYAERYRG